MRLYDKCEGCHRKKFFIHKRKIMLPIGEFGTSKKLMCGSCHRRILKMLKNNDIVKS